MKLSLTKIRLLTAAIVCFASCGPLVAQSTDPDTSDLPVLKAMPLYYTADSKTWLPDNIDWSGYSAEFWFNQSTHQFAYWLTGYRENGGIPDAYYYGRTGWQTFSITPGYVVGAIGDLNGNGLSDVVWTSSAHDLYLWTKNAPQTGYTSDYIGTYPTGWKLLGAGDINGDGFADLIWYNEQSCQFGYWVMQGNKAIRTRAINGTCGYRVAAIGDVNNNGLLDIIWTSDKNDLYIWYGDGQGFRSVYAGSYPAGQQLVAVGNFDGVYKTQLVGGQTIRLDRFNLALMDKSSRWVSIWEWFANAPWPNVTGGTVVPSTVTPPGTLGVDERIGSVVYSGGSSGGFVVLSDNAVQPGVGTTLLVRGSTTLLNFDINNYPAGTQVPPGVRPPLVSYPAGWRMISNAAN